MTDETKSVPPMDDDDEELDNSLPGVPSGRPTSATVEDEDGDEEDEHSNDDGEDDGDESDEGAESDDKSDERASEPARAPRLPNPLYQEVDGLRDRADTFAARLGVKPTTAKYSPDSADDELNAAKRTFESAIAVLRERFHEQFTAALKRAGELLAMDHAIYGRLESTERSSKPQDVLKAAGWWELDASEVSEAEELAKRLKQRELDFLKHLGERQGELRKRLETCQTLATELKQSIAFPNLDACVTLQLVEDMFVQLNAIHTNLENDKARAAAAPPPAPPAPPPVQPPPPPPAQPSPAGAGPAQAPAQPVPTAPPWYKRVGPFVVSLFVLAWTAAAKRGAAIKWLTVRLAVVLVLAAGAYAMYSLISGMSGPPAPASDAGIRQATTSIVDAETRRMTAPAVDASTPVTDVLVGPPAERPTVRPPPVVAPPPPAVPTCIPAREHGDCGHVSPFGDTRHWNCADPVTGEARPLQYNADGTVDLCDCRWCN